MKKIIFLIFLFIMVLHFNSLIFAGEGMKINELVSTNGDSYLDDNNNNPDWIELYNSSDKAVNLKDYRVYNKKNYNGAYILPDTIIQPKEFILLNCSEENRVGAGYYSIEAAGWGMVSIYNYDKFRFDYVEIEPGQDFDIQVNVRSLKASDLFTKVGLMFREELTEGSRFIGEFALIPLRGIFSFARRETVNTNLIPYYYGCEMMEFPDYWLRIKKVGDSVSCYNLYNNYAWRKRGQYYFPNKDKKMYLGISTASANENKNTKAYLTDLSINGKAYSFDSLKVFECLLQIPSKRYLAKDIHTNFKLKKGGAAIYLWDSKGNIADTLNYGQIDPDISYGRYPDGSNDLKMFLPSTPEATNQNSFEGRAATPTVSEEAGMYNNKVSLKIESTESDAAIYYSVDANDPDSNSTKYNWKVLTFTKNTVLKAIAYKKNMIPSKIMIQTYLINEKTDLPIVSLTSDPDNLYDSIEGMMVENNLGADIEKGACLEFWDNLNNSYYKSLVGIKLHGNSARYLPQKSIRLYARDRYGVDDFEYPFWGDESLDKNFSIILRTSSNDYYSLIRDGLASVIARRNPNFLAFAYRPVICYLNGEYYGIMSLSERIEEHYLAEKYDIDKDSINMLEDDFDLVSGSVVPYYNLYDSLMKVDMKDGNSFEFIDKNIELNNFIDYNIFEIYSNNADWPWHNMKYWNSNMLDGKWRWITYDFDWVYDEYPMTNTLKKKFVYDSALRYSKLMNKLFENENFKKKFIVRFADLMNTEYKPEKLVTITDSIAAIIRDDVPRHLKKWDTAGTDWENQVKIIKTFFTKRNTYMFTDIGRFFNIHHPDKITIDCSIPEAGIININTVSNISLPFEGKYFREYPLSITLIPNDGYTFVGWSDTTLPKNLSVVVNFDTTLNLTALFKDTSPYVDGTGDIVKNDFSFYPNPASDKLSVSFLLKNSGTLDIFLMDMLGNKVAVLNEKIEYYGGRHNYIFDLSGINSGVYNICLKLYGKNTVNLNKKVVIIK